MLGIFLMETIHTAAMLHFIYHYVIESPLNTVELNKVIWSAGAVMVTAICIIAFVQGFLAWRIYRLSEGNLRVAVGPAISLVLRTSIAFATAILILRAGTWSSARDSKALDIILIIGLSLNVVTDVLLATIFTYYLHRCKSIFESTRSIIKRVSMYTINTGALASVGSIIVVATFLASPTLTYIGAYVVVSKIYANSMLAQLNARRRSKECSCVRVEEISLKNL